MTKIHNKLIKSIWFWNVKNFISVAHKVNNKEFFHKMPLLYLYFYFASILMFNLHLIYIFLYYTLLCCRLIIIFHLPHHKYDNKETFSKPSDSGGQWWWNSPVEVKNRNKFSSTIPLREKVFENWLNKISFWAYVYSQIIFLHLFILFFDILNYSWRRGLRLRSHYLKTNVLLTSTGFLQEIFCNPPIILSIKGSFCGTRLSGYILTTRNFWSSLKASILWSLRTAPK